MFSDEVMVLKERGKNARKKKWGTKHERLRGEARARKEGKIELK